MLFKDVLPSASRDHGSGSGILGQLIFLFRPNEHVLECLRPPSLILLSGDGSPGYLYPVSEVISGAALTGVTVLKATLEMSNTKSINQ